MQKSHRTGLPPTSWAAARRGTAPKGWSWPVPGAAPVDYDVHGLVGIRLLNAPPSAAAGVGRQLGLAPASLSLEPDLTIRFVDRLPNSSPVRYLGQDDVGFTDDAFLLLGDRHGTRA